MGSRLNLTRFGYHLALGVISIRDTRDAILITDEKINHIPIRIFRPLNINSSPVLNNISNDAQLQPTIIFYHGGTTLLY